MKFLAILSAFVAASSAQGPSYCQFPFIHNNVRHTSCTTTNAPDGKPWCSTQTDNQGNHLKGNFVHCSAPSYCQMPFIYENVRYTECTTKNDPEGKLWCSTQTDNQNNHLTGNGNYRHCTDSSSPNLGVGINNDIDNTLLSLLTSNRNFIPQQQHSSGSCSLPDSGGTGTCIMLSQCGAYSSLASDLRNSNTLQYLIARLCRIENRRALVCCPVSGNQVSAPRPISNPVTTTRRPAPPTSMFPTVCGQSVDDRVVGGKEITPGAYPWLVAIGSLSSGKFTVTCGGSLITRKHVLSAAHCWDFGNPSHVRVGEHDLDSDSDGASPQDVRIATQAIHFSYNKDLSENDVALVTLEREVTFDNRIHPICLPFREDLKNNKFEGNNLDVVGWGKLDERTRATVPRPHEAKVGVKSISSCQQVYKNVRNIRITEKQLCAGGDGKTDSCQGDSGGPLNYLDNTQSRYYLAGITSTGVGCARPGVPGVYVRVGAYLDWIVSNVR